MTEAELQLAPGVRHPTAIVDEGARLAESVSVGPYSIIGPDVEVGEGTRIGPHVLIEKDTRIGERCEIHKGAVLGTDPQDLKYRGERTWLEVGRKTVIREFATLNRGTAASGVTKVGEESLVMAYAHIAHDCRIGNHVILSNAVNMGGHVEIGDWVAVGGLTAIHQFVRIGRHAFVGGASRLPQDVPPYLMVAGNPCASHGPNSVGLRRRGFDDDTLKALRRAYRQIFHSDLNIGDALDALEEEDELAPEVREMVDFIRSSERGIVTS